VFNNDVARMHIERIGQEMEVAVGVADARLADLGRRERVPVQGMTTHMLAELIASCAWPTIARFRSARGRSGVDVSG
jgi:predicted methyltransferase MtxX (methanogen marker protein 4)